MRALFVAIMLLFYFSRDLAFSQSTSCNNYFKYEIGVSKYDTPYLNTIGRYETQDGHILYYQELSQPLLVDESKRIDPHGFISNFKYAMGDAAAYFWGATQIGPYYSFADTDFLNRRVSRLNAILPSRSTIAIRFEVDRSEDYGNIEKRTSNHFRYIEAHSRGVVLMGDGGWIRKHDENYHVGSNLILSRRIQLEAMKKSQILIEFQKYFVDRNLLGEDQKSFFADIFKERSFEIDMTGNVFISLIFSKMKKSDYIKTLVDQGSVLSKYTQSFFTSEEYMESLIAEYATKQPIKAAFILRAFRHFMDGTLNASFYRTAPLYQTEEELADMVYKNYELIQKKSKFLQELLPVLPDFHL